MTHRINLKDWESSGLAAGRITALWPGFTGEYVRGLRHPAWDEYRTV